MVLVSACGGAVVGPSQTYQTLTSTAAVTSPLIGRGRGLSDAIVPGGNLQSGEATGTLTHNTGSTTLNGQVDSDGIDANGYHVLDGTAFNTAPQVPEFTGSYDFVRTFTGVFPFGGSEGFIGVATAPADMPSGTTATYIGEASGFAPNGQWTAAATTITANFGAGTLNLNAANTVGGVAATIDVTGAVIAGNTITGGTVTSTLQGVAANVTTGSFLGNISNVDGYFYGYDAANNTPDEIGIEIGTAGSDGSFDLTILAD